MLRDKKLMIEEIGMKFDEAIELFSDETLESMVMVNIVGGDTQTYCSGAQCVTGCNNNCQGCGSSSGSNSSSSSGSNSSSSSSSNIGDSSGTHVGNNNNTSHNGPSVPIKIYFSPLCGGVQVC